MVEESLSSFKLKEISVYQMAKTYVIYTTNGGKVFETSRTREYLLLFS